MSSTQYTRIPKFLNDLSERPFKLFLQFPPAWTKAKPVRLSHTHTKHSSSFHTEPDLYQCKEWAKCKLAKFANGTKGLCQFYAK